MFTTGRLSLIKTVLTTIVIYHMLSLDLPPWVFKSITKICHSFFWRGSEEAKGGHCLVSWEQICKPLEYGGLGIHRPDLLNDALQIRRLWLQKIGPLRSWSGLSPKILDRATHTFLATTRCTVGNGERVSFWHDRCIDGQSVRDIAPNSYHFIKARAVRGDRWLRHWITTNG